ncbi:hypothetical protein [Candidatus Berkiella aquae]|uniref:Uncharacterized protein n=1 Tax=Candidatus Berkiella aquae TaxID=295108 RepID=A0A0Q9YKQ7_9GAMM|nr:hypothetical protein [Candidatus Berkiella aquae]MCS5711070.1 hypothetical protein [Candidatus Berkiella aquae]
MGSACARRGAGKRPKNQKLLERYHPDEAKQYLESYDKIVTMQHDQSELKKIFDLGRECALRGEERPALENLLKNYTADQANIYLLAYDRTVGMPEINVNISKCKKTKRAAEPEKRNIRRKTKEVMVNEQPPQLENLLFNFSEYLSENEVVINELPTSLDRTPTPMLGYSYYGQPAAVPQTQRYMSGYRQPSVLPETTTCIPGYAYYCQPASLHKTPTYMQGNQYQNDKYPTSLAETPACISEYQHYSQPASLHEIPTCMQGNQHHNDRQLISLEETPTFMLADEYDGQFASLEETPNFMPGYQYYGECQDKNFLGLEANDLEYSVEEKFEIFQHTIFG